VKSGDRHQRGRYYDDINDRLIGKSDENYGLDIENYVVYRYKTQLYCRIVFAA